ncbi:cellular morphogenesis protein [Emericellopsis atlantica]|uniref:Cellular morphogenesis protein n=1 Tax=Emericellopsis atlantica TaxID=2614577 RepID=A0A9P8CUW8_9HYPO|nr:cellular morphogenesis protein [Emericellopsis atlantica]KAG9257866.1 cellular morphogenesis protein [Emericellopsis atlantica]
MRIQRGPRYAAKRLGLGLAAFAAWAPLAANSLTFEPAPSANLDLSDLGRIGVAGDFNGISLYEYEGQNGRPPSRNGSESLLGMLPNGALTSIVSADASIRAMCTFALSNGKLQGVVIGGNFTSLDGIESTAAALYNPETGSVSPLDGLKGEVNALYCDNDRDTVYVGGSFSGAASRNAIAWYADQGWTNLPFAGFNGPVEAISKSSSGHIIFGGSFTGLGNASTPREPDGQAINLSTANITAINSASDNGNPQDIVCAGGSEDGGTWLVQDNTPGFWEADFGFGFEPTKLRLWNAGQDGRGTKTFRFLAFPINGIMNLTYIDPASGENRTCTSECPLSNDADVKYQDFHFVNKVGMNRFQIAISEWYGSGAGLAGIELFQDDIFAYAVNDFNEPSCGGIQHPANATTTGPWRESPSLQSSSKYLTAELGDTASDSAKVVFVPNIIESGNYSVNMYTPGCAPDETCDRRGRVNVTGTMSSSRDDADFSRVLYQTNNYDKYDQIYFGYIEKTSDSFQPTVTLSPFEGEDINDQIIVAQRVGFLLINSTGGLNGLFDYNPSNADVDPSDFADFPVNELGASFDENTGVKTLVAHDDMMFIGGNFTSADHENIVAITSDDKVRNLNGGLNSQVLSMYSNDGQLYAGGDFTKSQDDGSKSLEHVAVYNVKDDSWSPLGGGVNGRVQHVVPFQVNLTDDKTENAIAFSGSFTEINSFEDNDSITVNGLAIWMPSEKNWLQNVGGSTPIYSGKLTTSLLDIPDADPLYAGSISSAQVGANGAVTLNDNGLGQFPLTLGSPAASSSSQNRRRDLFSDDSTAGVLTGTFFDDDDFNLTILAGHFTVQPSKGETINNLVIIDANDKDSISGLGSGISADSSFIAVEVSGKTLYAGGRVSGTVDDKEIGGIVAYNLESKAFGVQPPSITGANATVAAISTRPDRDSDIFVGGSFTRAGALDCPGICLYNVDSSQWIRPGSNVGGDVYSLMWSDKKTLIVGGDLQNTTGHVPLAVYKPDDEAWEPFPSADSVPGPVQVMTPGSSDSDQIWVAGVSTEDSSLFLMKYDGDKWQTAKHSLGSETVIHSLQVFSTTEGHDKNDLLNNKEVLMLTGSLQLPDFGMASAAIYNGTHFQPYAITTSSNGDPSMIAKIFSQKDNFFSSGKSHMALGFVVLIGLAISLGIILLIVVAGIVLDRLRKRREGYTPAPTSMYDRGSGIIRVPPGELFQSLGRGRSGAPQV